MILRPLRRAAANGNPEGLNLLDEDLLRAWIRAEGADLIREFEELPQTLGHAQVWQRLLALKSFPFIEALKAKYDLPRRRDPVLVVSFLA